MSTVLEDMVAWIRSQVPAALRRIRRGGDDKPDAGEPKPPGPRAPKPEPQRAPEPVAALHLHMLKETGKD